MSSDPDITQAFRDLREGLRRDLQPYVAEVSLNDLVLRIIADRISKPGWRPPLRRDPDVIADRRAANARQVLAVDPEGGSA
ncbi:hypothetical protein [Sphaerisporangium aureirubrum]|uniref:Uncharacterized protein n=1 Tax=Sphaerisporangium aureirubrum TaxID=1544736 RepID=A0ABW1NCC2_9ACTN